MKDLAAESLSPFDAATLWPQLHRLATEVIATRAGENLFLRSGLAATGLTRLPRMPRTAVLGLKRGLNYRGVLAARELAGGAGWEVVSVRIARDKDDEAVLTLLASAAEEVARRGGRTLYLRVPEGSTHREPIRRSGLMPYRLERLYAVPRSAAPDDSPFRAANRRDRHGIFRLYCRAVPEHIRRQEAPTQQDWRAVHDSFDCEREFVLDHEGALAAWAGFADRECRLLFDGAVEGLRDTALDLVELQAARHGTLVLGEDQGGLEQAAVERGYQALGVRLVCARRLALLNPLKEVVAVPASAAIPQ